MPDETEQGRWDPVFGLPDVAIHVTVLPTGKVLAWGRRKDPHGGMDQQGCAPFVWDPVTGTATPTEEPRRGDGTTPVNLFCSGHTLLADGRLLVAGGHIRDGDGLDQACLYDATGDSWTALPPLRSGRWYPSAITLADGRALVISGSHQDGPNQPVEPVPEIWDGTSWQPTRDFIGLPLYPRIHLTPDNRIAMSGSNPLTKLLDTTGPGEWTPPPGPDIARAKSERQYGPAVMYSPGRILYLGGGNDLGDDRPTADCEKIDLTAPSPAWEPAASMAFRRRHHNATLLPDGTVLVTGGTSGPGFNDLVPGAPVHSAELWDPGTDTWTTLAAEDVDRCYHSTAILLPDATVLSAGGGEFVIGVQPNDPADTHRDAQIFHPPYLFRGPRPAIDAAPDDLTPGQTFTLTTTGAPTDTVTLLRLGSTTHTLDADQRFLRLTSSGTGQERVVTVPENPAECPPGHYMLFALSADGVPSTARIVRVGVVTPTEAPTEDRRERSPAGRRAPRAESAGTGTVVTIGLTAQCPYGLGPCWGGAYSALSHLEDVVHVDPVPNQTDQTAQVSLAHQGLPDLSQWPEQFASWANASYVVRGVEVSMTGTLVATTHLGVPALDQPLPLRPMVRGSQLAWDLRRRRRRPLTPDERGAYERLVAERPRGEVTVTGPLRLVRGRPVLSVRVVDAGS
ncbi:galactose oxidase-like domain-containing protein [Actinomycetospora callitridis]|uniref:galactose oxidase-like domain-containing protein n=1 Tax=Actinomycetospora callitridis TaxID=913944 RepID=UPI0023663869|nr:galactose oxidase-like domain-containing protein [Actinomycetospora callitridis]MDD7920664.1 DUF1929 domain-containing protein [Actinomycetospora callitridis]